MASIRRRTSERIRRRTAGSSSAEQVECCDDLITDILSRVSTRDALRMSTVSKRWHTLIFNPDFVHIHCKNRPRKSILCLMDVHSIRDFPSTGIQTLRDFPSMQLNTILDLLSGSTPKQYEFRSFNSQSGNLSIVPFSCESLDSSFQNGDFVLITASNGLMCLYPRRPVDPLLWVYNPVRKVSKKLPMPFKVDRDRIYFAEIFYVQNTLKFVMAGFSVSEKRRYTLVFDSHSNSWYEGPPLLIDLSDYSFRRAHLFLNGVIYFVGRVKMTSDQELIIGYDVNKDQWGFSFSIPSTVGSVYCLTEWKGNLLVCAARSNGHFVLWILDTEHKLWIRERDLGLSNQVRTSWKVSASGGVVWFTRGYNSVKVYHMKNRHWSTHRLDDASAPQTQISPSFVTFEPTLLSF